MGEYNPFKSTAIIRKDLSVPMKKLYEMGIFDVKDISKEVI